MSQEENMPNNAEIDQALKEFELKSNQGQKFFNENQSIPTADASGLIAFVMKYSGGIIKEQKQAEYLLLALAIIAILISIFLFFAGSNKRPTVTPRDLILTPPSRII